ncbi:MAG: Na+/H+ antiporter NhaA [Dehalococcoidia bacterium]|nr:Na+/H+ antiporter NhaA [Dehalococcoidia bacterium]
MERRPALRRLVLQPLQAFLETEAAGGIVLLTAAVAALVWANVADGSTYASIWGTPLRLGAGRFAIDEPLQRWVNDALMAVFFYVVGLEVKREALQGELADRRRMALPIAAAGGGMLVPALIYLAVNAGGAAADGWGIPMATDIAFAVGIVALVGARVPPALKVFLLALAIIDDIGAIVVIAIFYSGGVAWGWLAGAAALLALVALLVRSGVRAWPAYALAAVVVWIAVFESGVHATIAGVALGVLTPLAPLPGRRLQPDTATGRPASGVDVSRAAESTAFVDDRAAAPSPLERLERTLHPWTSYLIIPVFALANAGVKVDADALGDALQSRVAVGVALGLIFGKPGGILVFSMVAVKTGLAALPAEVDWPRMAAVATIAGVGFTVSLFISALAFGGQQLVDDAKLGILGGSVVMGIIGYAALRWTTRTPDEASPPRAGDAPATHRSGR